MHLDRLDGLIIPNKRDGRINPQAAWLLSNVQSICVSLSPVVFLTVKWFYINILVSYLKENATYENIYEVNFAISPDWQTLYET